MTNEHRCQYKNCKAIADYNTKFGKFCSYHYNVLNKKKGVKLHGEKIEYTKAERDMLKKFMLHGGVQIKLAGGKK